MNLTIEINKDLKIDMKKNYHKRKINFINKRKLKTKNNLKKKTKTIYIKLKIRIIIINLIKDKYNKPSKLSINLKRK